MLLQPLMDKLTLLHLPAFRKGIEEQIPTLSMRTCLSKIAFRSWSIWRFSNEITAVCVVT